MKNPPWFSLLINEEARAVIIELFQSQDQSAAINTLNAILQNAATAVLIQELPKESSEFVLKLISSNDYSGLQKWLQQQPEEIKISLRERLDRTLLELQSQLVGR
ncbi:MAG: hypothetical protein COU65_01035 [Candidatus Pacebacteria bacterium CG10_big_fil_rev_8_21_14_0_10_42_12]|nr:hypothetical protein [Candidatus Paceibacterota bacterium]PIR62892.1 MAG: hypothetical protein COU65_01035 [Candidatus Pacebacteria bacterium CG10_big_fil_rev_8_21_14_0_10_42_12]